jgi:hypothetical protein
MYRDAGLVRQHSSSPTTSGRNGPRQGRSSLEPGAGRTGLRRQDRGDDEPTLVEPLTALHDASPTLRDLRTGTIESPIDDIDTTPRRITAQSAHPPAVPGIRRWLLPSLTIGTAAALGAFAAWMLPVGGHLGSHHASAVDSFPAAVIERASAIQPEAAQVNIVAPATPPPEAGIARKADEEADPRLKPEALTSLPKPSRTATKKRHHTKDVAGVRAQPGPRSRAGQLTLEEF